MAKKIIIFDYDGTLVDTMPTVVSILSDIRRLMGKDPLSNEEMLSYISEGGSILIKKTLDVPDIDIDYYLKLFRSCYRENDLRLDRVYPGVIEVLESLTKMGLKLWICSNKPGMLLERGLDHHYLAGYFSKVIAGDSGPYAKPNKLMLEDFLKNASQNYRDDVLIVGDSKFDRDLAKNCNIDFYFHSNGYNDIDSFEGLNKFNIYKEFDFSNI